jgi:hypothetical protein
MTTVTATTPTNPPWLQTLQHIAQRNGAIEIATLPGSDCHCARVIQHDSDSFSAPTHASWRVRVLSVADDVIVVERPWSVNTTLHFETGQQMTALIIEGSDRWWFATEILEQTRFSLNASKQVIALKLRWPSSVHSAQRRDYFRMDVSSFDLPLITVAPITDTSSCIPAEIACAAQLRKQSPEPARLLPMPLLGEVFRGHLIDISGGGIGITLPKIAQPILQTLPLLWVNIPLPGHLTPLVTVVRPTYWRIECAKNLRAGMAFSFLHNPPYEKFITEQMCHLTAHFQRLGLQRRR